MVATFISDGNVMKGGGTLSTKKYIPKIWRKKREKYAEKSRNTIKISVGTTTYMYIYIYMGEGLLFICIN